MDDGTEDVADAEDGRLIQAAFAGTIDEVRRLLDEGCDIEGTAEHGTPLHAAVENGRPDVVRFLIDRGADVNGRGASGGWTPLLHAVDAACDAASQMSLNDPPADATEVIQLLLERGADPSLVDRHDSRDLTPARLAHEYGRHELAQFLTVMRHAHNGLAVAQICDRLPGVEAGDVQACLDFVAGRKVRSRPAQD